jgi:hypothetical protein
MSDRVEDGAARRSDKEVNGTVSQQVARSAGTHEDGARKVDDPAGSGANGSSEPETVGEPTSKAAGVEEATGNGKATSKRTMKTGSKRSGADRFRAAFGKVLGITSSPEFQPALEANQINELRALVLEKPTSDEVSEELSITLGLAQRLRSEPPCDVDSSYERFHFIFDCLLDDPPKLILARDERLRLQVEVYQQSGLVSRILARISAGSPVALVLTALVASLIIWAAVFQVVRLLSGLGQGPAIFFMDGQALGITAFAALVGGIVSIATRLREFSRVRDLDPFAMFWTALLKPLVGVVLAVFILATLAGDVVSLGFLGADPLGLKDGAQAVAHKTWYILWVLGFLAGFSERFAWDFVDRAQGVASGSAGAPKPLK